ncbi:DUF3854 domain-containing protein [Mycolicibacterium monacense]|uniref:DUF3854 domain-containing protein n=1 Tax=Mycolicibacterium monacense TaxID=85693 RepID=A0AAD1IUZ0_MYCMB|nr:DUF3854 domain-containing protein [Mycolicibacterium monacense]QHP86790.1 DUF3854 domain-containing protein [Mycolicibacterium monacense DSM 44395]BBZ60137.1 hypothetical protein MMON_14380 [Mycolicibacterium monacense]
MIAKHHLDALAASGITGKRVELRGYETVNDKGRLIDVGVAQAGRRVPGLLVPSLRADGSTWGYQYRPDYPRTDGKGREVKYETPVEQRNGIDIPPGVGDKVGDPSVPLFVTEGVKKADCAAEHGLCCVALPGVWSWRGKNDAGGKTAVADWHDVALNDRRVILAFDGDVARKQSVRQALSALADYLRSKGAKVEYLHLPDTDNKTGLDDYLIGHTVEELWRLVKPSPAPLRESTVPNGTGAQNYAPAAPEPVAAEPITLDQAHTVFRRWLGDDYDTDALDAVLATAAVERLDGDPLWLLLISGSGNAKTETVQALDGVGAVITSTITEAGLLSATPRKDRAKDATGGLLRKLEPRGVLVIKDVTSILSMNTETRAQVLGALREVYDGRWSRNVGADGGLTLEWAGRIAVIGAVTTAWDKAHAVIASMGDRFVLVRMDSTKGRQVAGRKAIGNTGSEVRMRAELAAAVAGVLAGINTEPVTVTDEETDVLLRAADLVTLARTGVEYDYRGDVIDAHAPEMPTRFAKQLAQIVRGGVALGMERVAALRLAIRCARDSMPPLRLAIIDDLADEPDSSTAEIRKRIGKPRATVDRQLQALHMLEVLDCDEAEGMHRGKPVTIWYYRLADGIEPTALDSTALDSLGPNSVPEIPPPTPNPYRRTDRQADTPVRVSDISGTDPSLLRRLITGPGRCDTCGCHIATQGHKPECPAAAA